MFTDPYSGKTYEQPDQVATISAVSGGDPTFVTTFSETTVDVIG
jgi:hypothetical protein